MPETIDISGTDDKKKKANLIGCLISNFFDFELFPEDAEIIQKNNNNNNTTPSPRKKMSKKERSPVRNNSLSPQKNSNNARNSSKKRSSSEKKPVRNNLRKNSNNNNEKTPTKNTNTNKNHNPPKKTSANNYVSPLSLKISKYINSSLNSPVLLSPKTIKGRMERFCRIPLIAPFNIKPNEPIFTLGTDKSCDIFSPPIKSEKILIHLCAKNHRAWIFDKSISHIEKKLFSINNICDSSRLKNEGRILENRDVIRFYDKIFIFRGLKTKKIIGRGPASSTIIPIIVNLEIEPSQIEDYLNPIDISWLETSLAYHSSHPTVFSSTSPIHSDSEIQKESTIKFREWTDFSTNEKTEMFFDTFKSNPGREFTPQEVCCLIESKYKIWFRPAMRADVNRMISITHSSEFAHRKVNHKGEVYWLLKDDKSERLPGFSITHFKEVKEKNPNILNQAIEFNEEEFEDTKDELKEEFEETHTYSKKPYLKIKLPPKMENPLLNPLFLPDNHPLFEDVEKENLKNKKNKKTFKNDYFFENSTESENPNESDNEIDSFSKCRACIPCRLAHVACDRAGPPCSKCSYTNPKQCTYTSKLITSTTSPKLPQKLTQKTPNKPQKTSKSIPSSTNRTRGRPIVGPIRSPGRPRGSPNKPKPILPISNNPLPRGRPRSRGSNNVTRPSAFLGNSEISLKRRGRPPFLTRGRGRPPVNGIPRRGRPPLTPEKRKAVNYKIDQRDSSEPKIEKRGRPKKKNVD